MDFVDLLFVESHVPAFEIRIAVETRFERGNNLGYGSVRDWSGSFNITSDVEDGSCVEILLPRSVHHQNTAVKPFQENETSLRERLTVLLVEDNPGVREVLEQSLGRNEFDVLSASDGVEAMQIFTSSEHKIDVVLSDVSMPRMTGSELARELKATQPDIPILLMSGYPLIEEAQAIAVEIISKPVAGKMLVDRLRSLKRQLE